MPKELSPLAPANKILAALFSQHIDEGHAISLDKSLLGIPRDCS
jgi:hypothetical protein